MGRGWHALGAGICLLVGVSVPVAAACPPDGWDARALETLREAGFAVGAAPRRQALALDLVDCLGDADPGLRDDTAYAALSAWMRGGQLDTATLRSMRDALYARLDAPAGEGFSRPFAALALAEVARTDRRAPWMDPGERDAMVDRATRYLRSVEDYRGFDPAGGWRHGVAHGADWLMQLSLNPALGRAQLRRLVDAAGSQVVPASHAYVFGEPERLAAPVLYAAARGVMDEGEWAAWFADLAVGLGDEALAWKDRDWLYRRHDLRAFLMALRLAAGAREDEATRALLPGIDRALASMP
ncbi:DUF2785 domain-containing protein [Marilutibacter aestuarii]|uniref:DUF2785 domain-containing protein n=1 Tax=Marilutibacter aestuarii TaxID=1706195 RepID=A0A508A5D3_9GAMM|nr:DUF2785 domain-containing protein [Lysobacter aestuarii]TQD45159.1 DUF2785 domain-containing protein [Lysobacter aestuarii]